MKGYLINSISRGLTYLLTILITQTEKENEVQVYNYCLADLGFS